MWKQNKIRRFCWQVLSTVTAAWQKVHKIFGVQKKKTFYNKIGIGNKIEDAVFV